MGESPRVVTVASLLHRLAYFFFHEDEVMINNEKEYGQIAAYCVSKLCNLLFTLELDRRLQAAGINKVTTVAAKPGHCDTNIMKKKCRCQSEQLDLVVGFSLGRVRAATKCEEGCAVNPVRCYDWRR
ncbi:hypothetical protein PC110_g20548 [Phytophthora cactorum]|uniref:NAD(P)-binding domain n=1 Tax=Phytophthora cactorum TaxID=29920 RepID=A0A329RE99_9STRA|nr:hypothetical protein PC119_g26997 [Phytophthora cactorum]KAG2964880.1 hypothetical protein PC120_g27321 [Phytophthora cactorum]KAG3030362.1 hypothetical protein PC121_g24505 [Phytophthora cactorum]KAG3128114.1 hypothetical protein PC128_g27017 [Phytophthora cactorum]RAW23015.1 hypothetical protein PC110_g20548 [Phytophthora cactorum]